ncbi:Helix-turn-helix [Arthrobacter saudimassiliensis]|uniref:Helix-turn-helix n=1 Tax=Arthrobacter saudimassiliensis TaxID=1461584 RepID=A0A078MSY6_9MICC|nr:Helix-turn-helix [Arthrobacter saudimassiliensis]
MSSSDLGVFLKARRGNVQPADVGIRAQRGRRVAGLRREEVAMLAGVSVDYYARLEQGREKNPSPSVLNALAGALNLDADLREHVFRLAGLAPTPWQPADDAVDESLLELLAAWPHTPALIINRQLDILARNDLAAALYSGFARMDNLVRMTFIDPFGRSFFTDWQRAGETCVANLRLALGHAGAQEAVQALVAEAHAASAEFRVLWSRHDVRGKTAEAKAFRHPALGDLLLDYNAFDVRSAPGQQLVVYQAPAGSPSAEKLQLLGSLAASAPVSG